MIRAFIAIDIPEDVRAAIDEAQARLKRAHLGVKVSWTKIDNIHLTLQFLGYVEEPVIDKIKSALQGVAAQQQPFEVSVQGVGAFPNESRPRVIWVGCHDTSGELKTLAGAVQTAMDPLGFEPERREFSAHLTDTSGELKTLAGAVQTAMDPLGFEPERREFSAHLTLGRVKVPRPDGALTKALDSIKNAAFGMLRVEAIHLFESQLHPDGSIYTKLSSHALGNAELKGDYHAAKS